MVFFRNNFRGLATSSLGSYYATLPRRNNQNTRFRYGEGVSQTMTQTKRRKRGGNLQSFRSHMLNNTSAKHFTDTGNVSMLHDNIYSFNITAQITQGDSNSNRDGDSINLEALKIRGFFSSSSIAGAYGFRMLVGYSGEEYTAANFTTSGLTGGEIFLPGAPTNYTALVNPKAFTCLLDFNVDINSQIADTSDLASFFKSVLLKQKFDYQATGSQMGKTKNLYIVVIGNAVGGTLATTIVGETIIGTDCIFK